MSSTQLQVNARKPFRLLTVLDKMIIGDLLKTVSAVLSVLVAIIVSRKFIKILAKAIEGNIANDTVMTLLGLKIIVAAANFLPAATFMAALMVFGRMYRDQEMSAIASAGGGVLTLYRSVMWLVLPLVICGAGLSMYAAPWAEARTAALLHDDKQDADIRGIAAGRFSEYSNGELIFYTEQVDTDGKMRQVFVQNKQGSRLGVVNAESGRLEMLPGGLYLILQNGERVQGIPGQKDYVVERFAEYAVLVEKKASVLNFGREAFGTEQLWQSTESLDVAEMRTRFNVPAGVFLLTFLAVPLAKLSPRGGIYGSMLLAFGIYFIYGNLQKLNHSWIVKQNIPVWLGYFWVDAVLFAIGLLLLLRLYGWRWWLMLIQGKANA